MIIFNIFATIIVSIIPISVGINIERRVSLLLFVSFFMVKIVVKQGKWHIVNIIKDIAVIIVHPLFVSIVDNSFKLL